MEEIGSSFQSGAVFKTIAGFVLTGDNFIAARGKNTKIKWDDELLYRWLWDDEGD